jgi:hypothetical protein
MSPLMRQCNGKVSPSKALVRGLARELDIHSTKSGPALTCLVTLHQPAVYQFSLVFTKTCNQAIYRKSRFKGVRRESSALPRIKDNKTIRVADEDAPEDYRGQQSIFLGRYGVFPGVCWRREGYLLNVE